MTDKLLIDRAVIEQALEALTAHPDWRRTMRLKMDTIDALRAALEQPAEQFKPTPLFAAGESGVLMEFSSQEPVAYLWTNIQSGAIEVTWDEDAFSREMWHRAPLYTAPQPAKREPLTDDEIRRMWKEYAPIIGGVMDFARAIERAHGIGGKA